MSSVIGKFVLRGLSQTSRQFRLNVCPVKMKLTVLVILLVTITSLVSGGEQCQGCDPDGNGIMTKVII